MDAGARARGRDRPLGHWALIAIVAVAATVLGGIAATSARPGRDAASVTPRPSFVPLPDDVRVTADDVDAALAFVHGEGARVLLTIAIDGSFGSFTNLPAGGMPEFGAGGDVPGNGIRWAEHLGEYYGVGLWIAGLEGAEDAGRELCLVTELESGGVRAKCAPRPLWELGALFVTVGADELSAGERPDGMAAGEVLAFWWTANDAVVVLRGTPPPAR